VSQMPVSLVVRLCTDDESVCDFFNRLDDEEEFRFVLLAQCARTTEYGCACVVLAQCLCTVSVLPLCWACSMARSAPHFLLTPTSFTTSTCSCYLLAVATLQLLP
jgi:hypothetical protein